jgi:hypothetical protein
MNNATKAKVETFLFRLTSFSFELLADISSDLPTDTPNEKF